MIHRLSFQWSFAGVLALALILKWWNPTNHDGLGHTIASESLQLRESGRCSGEKP